MASNAATGALAVLALSVLFVLGARSAFEAEFRLRAQELTKFFAAQSGYPLAIRDSGALAKIADTLLRAEDVRYVEVTDAGGNTLVQRRRQGFAAPPRGLSGEGQRSRETNGGMVLEVTEPVAADSDGILDWDRSRAAAGRLGYVRVGFSMRKRDALLWRMIRYAAGVAAFLSLFVAPAQGWELKRLLSPLQELIRFTRKVDGGDLTARAAVMRADEIGELTLAFNQMLDRLSSTTVCRNYVDAVLQSMAECLMVIDAGGRIRTANAAALEMLGYSAAELIGMDASAIRSSGAGSGLAGADDVFIAKNGRRIPVVVSCSLLRGPNVTEAGCIWVAQDMTALQQTQQELIAAKEEAEQASAAKSIFLATMSHELRTPLNAIAGFCQLLEFEMTDRGADHWLSDLRKINEASDHLLNLINDILDLSKIDAGRMRLAMQPFDIGQMALEVSDELQPAAARNGNALSVSLPPALRGGAPAWGDATRVKQCLANLVGNACKFTANGTVAVEVLREKQADLCWYSLSVRDTGIGIAPEHLPRLFRDFGQVDPSTTRKYGGTGLGLAVSRRLARMMGGDITVQSKPGEGSVFTLRIPARAKIQRNDGEAEAGSADGVSGEEEFASCSASAVKEGDQSS